MVFVPPDRTMRRERVSRVGAAALVVVSSLACLGITAFGTDSGVTRIAVVPHAGPSTPPPMATPVVTASATSVPRTFTALTAVFPVPDQAKRVPKHRTTWQARMSLAAARQFYLDDLSVRGLTWSPAATRRGGRVVGWDGPIAGAAPLGQLSVRTTTKAGIVSIATRR